ncbi:MAG: hypothetical protein Q4G67_06745 [Actinomycetia bacterium]|nr:hypothetical protein [Actinomycetes bacterium]
MSAATESPLTFADRDSLADLGRYAARAKALDAEAAIRLQAHGPVLAAWVGVLPGNGLLGEGLVLGLRTFALAEPTQTDAIVPAAAITDRTAHAANALVLPLPPVRLTPDWSSLTPPRSGWEYAGAASGDDLAQVARSGVEQVSAAVQERGAAAGLVKQQVWSALVTYSDPTAYSTADPTEKPETDGVELPAGVALAAFTLGFLRPGEPVQVFRTNRWTRVSGPGGHVLSR